MFNFLLKVALIGDSRVGISEFIIGVEFITSTLQDWKLMSTSTFCCGKLYISEARNKLALESIERAAKQFPDAPIVNEFKDETYNRVGYTLVSLSSDSLKNAVFSMAKAAYEVIDLDLHTGSHPRLGVVDHICFHPLAATSLEQVATIARAIAKEVGSKLKVPCYTYGAARKDQRSLDAVRRELGYYKPNASGQQWSGGLQAAVLPLEPDEGPAQVVKAKGVVVIGATKWVDNYNVPVFCTDICTVGRIARRVSGRGGGLASVQSLALVHDNNVIEVACKMLEPSEVGGEQVQGLIEQLGAQACVKVGKGYFTDLSPDAIVRTYFKLTSSS
ncbi:putative 5-formyltetrahydrofolate cyclo-ligase, Glutamate formimidoyltransferase [Helianthus annuus]|uniref:5-formyltetrahydrofolate cyclo-ligase, Glutamate formimidoyltransferase n=2 Tax=Helianthus annuus TaxID=4232 RepID=A0A9K3GT49_HELAN|nr:putative 5-formyltetrahydrofolate cyclo-ligase, Glutamate formimidoyltransferase [Helianthus annuus]KAJ0824186.1 putative 5-formyltetrahydrofolate cyclo-ligase, Glutamate formimidoyltransferase [Helianthus annuus]